MVNFVTKQTDMKASLCEKNTSVTTIHARCYYI